MVRAMSDEKKMRSFRLNESVMRDLDRVAAMLRVEDRTTALECAIRFAARPAGERAESVLGTLDAQRVEQALECWTNLLARASADNGRAFNQPEWCMIADVCNGTIWETGVENPATMLAANVSDGHSLDGTGYKWFGDDATDLAGSLNKLGAGKSTAAMKVVDGKISVLVHKLAALDGVHAWAVIVAVQWFWDHCGDIDAKGPWWTLAFRRNHARSGRMSTLDDFKDAE